MLSSGLESLFPPAVLTLSRRPRTICWTHTLLEVNKNQLIPTVLVKSFLSKELWGVYVLSHHQQVTYSVQYHFGIDYPTGVILILLFLSKLGRKGNWGQRMGLFTKVVFLWHKWSSGSSLSKPLVKLWTLASVCPLFKQSFINFYH